MKNPLVSSLCALLLLVGCFETKLTLGPKDAATVDTAFVGNWVAGNPAAPDEPKNTLVIRNLDGKQYFVEWTDPKTDTTKEKTTRMVGYTAAVRGVLFAHLRELAEDGSIPEKHLVMRVELKDDKLTLRNLSDEFFKNNPVNTDAEFRHIVEENLDNAAMYDEDAIIALRVAGK